MPLSKEDLDAVEARVDACLSRRLPLASATLAAAVAVAIAEVNWAGLVQTELSRQLLPGEWLFATPQLYEGGSIAYTAAQRGRIMANCGCDANGVWWDAKGDPMPAFGRGFEQADSVTENDRLYRVNSTSFVFDVKAYPGQNGTQYGIDQSRPMFTLLDPGVTGTTLANHPTVHAIRARSWADVDDWVRRTAAGRTGKG